MITLDELIKSPKATGIDISKWNDKFDIDTPDIAKISEVIDFAIIRIGYANQSGSFKDERLDLFYAELVQHPTILRGGYWYFSSQTSWEDQLNLFIHLTDGKDFDFFALDFETIYNVKSAGFALTAIRFMKRIQELYPKKRVLLYSNYYTYRDWMRVYTADCDEWPYWHAQYPYANWSSTVASFTSWIADLFAGKKQPYLPPSRNGAWDIWQVADKTSLGAEFGLGGENVDINISNKNLSEFKAWIGSIRGEPVIPDVKPDFGGVISELESATMILTDSINKLKNMEDNK